jgi:hypothetical protein
VSALVKKLRHRARFVAKALMKNNQPD